MSRVHDALRRAEFQMPAGFPAPDGQPPQQPPFPSQGNPSLGNPSVGNPSQGNLGANGPAGYSTGNYSTGNYPTANYPAPSDPGMSNVPALVGSGTALAYSDVSELLNRAKEIVYKPDTDAHLIDPDNPQAPPGEEFRTLRTRLNHLQSLSPIKTLVVTSASPAEGKSFAAINLALSQAQLDGQRTLLCDFDFRRPVVHTRLGVSRTPGLTDYLLGQCELGDIIYKVKGMNLYVMPAGQSVINPLELLNLRECRNLIEMLPKYFNWSVLDTPPILYAADASLMSTICHGSVLVVRLGHTTIDTVTRAMQSLCTNNVVGTIVNGARQGELYSRYRYYRYYYEPRKGQPGDAGPEGGMGMGEADMASPGGAGVGGSDGLMEPVSTGEPTSEK